MQKSLIRDFKSHYGSCWRCQNNTVHSKVILRTITAGKTLVLDCGMVYPNIENTVVNEPGLYQNVLALNPMRFKYQTLEQLHNQIALLQKQTQYQGTLFVSFNFQFVNFNRLRENFYQELDNWINKLGQQNLVLVKNYTKNLPRANDWGDCFFIFKNYEILSNNLL